MSLTISTEPAIHELPLTPRSHFKLVLVAAVLRLLGKLVEEPVTTEFPFLQSYIAEAESLCGARLHESDLCTQLQERIASWESEAECWFPLRALLSELGLKRDALDLLLTVGLIEEDARFGALFEWAQPGSPGQQRPTLGLLTAWWREQDDCAGVRNDLRQLSELALITVINPEAPRLQWAYEATPLLWDVLRGDPDLRAPSFKFCERDGLPTLENLVLPEEVRAKARTLAELLANGEVRGVTVRGPLHNGRKTLLGAVARAAGYGALRVQGGLKADNKRAACLGTLCAVLHAMPLFTFELSPGETARVPDLGSYQGPQGVAVSRYGSLESEIAKHSCVFELTLPGSEARLQLWSCALDVTQEQLPEGTGRFRLTTGGIMQAAELARTQARLAGRNQIREVDVRQANRALQQPLENQAVRVESCQGWDHIVAAPDVLAELRSLADRCRYREQLAAVLGETHAAGMNHGVRALLGGPSGSGKTLAARVLAHELQLDLYRLDLSAVVNKYIGETEKNLNQVLSRAEELNVILLLDEGDALLTNRTAVQSSNDRYANLETNFLLQRIESFEGILFVTTNALQRIDGAFQRRMDVLIEFRPPDPEERRQIWYLHLPAGHEVSERWLEEAARRCALSGGQIRNAALHASLLALGRHSIVTTQDAETAVLREYQKMGAVCPLRRTGLGR